MLVEIPLFREVGVSGDANVDGGMSCWERGYLWNVYATSGTSLSSRFISGRRRRHPVQLGALVVSGGAGIQGNVNVGGYAGVVGDMDGVVVRSYMAV
jgi:hypothetical protein